MTKILPQTRTYIYYKGTYKANDIIEQERLSNGDELLKTKDGVYILISEGFLAVEIRPNMV